MWRHAAGDIFLISTRAFARLVLREQPRQDGGVVVDDRVGDQPRALVADLDFDVGPAGQFLLVADLGDGRAELVVGLDAVLRAVHVSVATAVAQRVDAARSACRTRRSPAASGLTW